MSTVVVGKGPISLVHFLVHTTGRVLIGLRNTGLMQHLQLIFQILGKRPYCWYNINTDIVKGTYCSVSSER